MDTSERIHWIDVMKGILIIIVIMGHLGYSCSLSLGHIPNSFAFATASFFMCVFCVHFYMAAFFYVTGYCTKANKTCKHQLKKDFLTLIIPAVVIPRIMNIVTWHATSIDTFLNPLHELPWFLVTMFWSRTIFTLIGKMEGKIKIYLFPLLFVIGILLLLYLPEYNFLFIYHALVFTVFVKFGAYCRKIKISKKWINVMAISYFIFACIHYKVTHSVIGICGIPSISLQYIPSWFVLSVLGTTSIVAISQLISHNKVLEYLGRHTLVIYLTHLSWMVTVTRLLSDFIKEHEGETIASLLVVVVIAGGAIIWSSLFSWLFERKYLKWALGKF